LCIRDISVDAINYRIANVLNIPLLASVVAHVASMSLGKKKSPAAAGEPATGQKPLLIR
jgi:hypothetical protein